MAPMRPMLATPGTHVPAGDAWVHEVKWDGVRALTEVRDGTLRMTSRNENVITVAWPELATSPYGGRDLFVDGEIIAINDRGVPDFRTLQERMHVRKTATAERLSVKVPAIYMVFDLLRLDGRDLAPEPLEVRRAALESLEIDGSWQVPPQYDDGAMLFEATLQQGLEGVVSKRRTSVYRFGERTPHWLKLPHRHRLSYVVGGWRPQEGTTDRLAALLVGELTPDGLLYRGRVGSGIGPRQSRALTEVVAGLERADSPFADEVPAVDARGTHWLRPVLVVDIDTHGRGYERLRQPSFQGVRSDLAPEDLLA
ncbi:MAG: non-homologous end-joining DNA ligase [Nocardioidaceae bacterium]|nr:non-homologous end-joining DNA ligase [Nocardioidaceae bacterium]